MSTEPHSVSLSWSSKVSQMCLVFVDRSSSEWHKRRCGGTLSKTGSVSSHEGQRHIASTERYVVFQNPPSLLDNHSLFNLLTVFAFAQSFAHTCEHQGRHGYYFFFFFNIVISQFIRFFGLMLNLPLVFLQDDFIQHENGTFSVFFLSNNYNNKAII